MNVLNFSYCGLCPILPLIDIENIRKERAKVDKEFSKLSKKEQEAIIRHEHLQDDIKNNRLSIIS